MKTIVLTLLTLGIASIASAQQTATLNRGAGYIPNAEQDCNQIQNDFAHNWTSSDETVTITQRVPCGQHTYYVVNDGSGTLITVRDSNLFFNHQPTPPNPPHGFPTTATLNRGAGYIDNAEQDCNQIARDFAHNWTSDDQTVSILQRVPCFNHTYYIVRDENGSTITVRDSNLFFGNNPPQPQPQPQPPRPQPHGPNCAIRIGFDANGNQLFRVITPSGAIIGTFQSQQDAINFAQSDQRCFQ